MLKIKPRTVLRSRTGAGSKKVLLGGVVFVFVFSISFFLIANTILNSYQSYYKCLVDYSDIGAKSSISNLIYSNSYSINFIQSAEALTSNNDLELDLGTDVFVDTQGIDDIYDEGSYECPCGEDISIWDSGWTVMEKLLGSFANVTCKVICFVGKLTLDIAAWILNFVPMAPL